MKTGYVHSIESFATFEGKGIRTAIFFSGCPLRCAYCHNPDTWESKTGKFVTAEELVKKVLRFKPYFGKDGGVTFSGGEPLVQTEFLIETAKLCKENGLNIAIDTAMSTLNEQTKTLYRLVDTVIGDLKFSTAEEYQAYTGADILHTVLETLAYLNEIKKPVILRTVILPGINDTKESIAAYAGLVKNFKNIETYELKPFHTMGFQKYQTLNIPNPLLSSPAMDSGKVKELEHFLRASWKE